jgi:hypothetical protein
MKIRLGLLVLLTALLAVGCGDAGGGDRDTAGAQEVVGGDLGGGDGISPNEDSPGSCQDGHDNDQDGNTDCDDPECQGYLFCNGAVEDTAALCSDEEDNDGDEQTDCADRDCQVFVFCAPKSESSPDLCRDNMDNDGDGDTDCGDSGCNGYLFCAPPSEDSFGECSDGTDNDGDGDKDCADQDCSVFRFCSSSGAYEDGPTVCRDGLDNDADGATDCGDRDCWLWYFCGRYQGGPVVDSVGDTWDRENRVKLPWVEADAICQAKGGRLPSATELYRNNFTNGAGSLGKDSNFLWTALPNTNDNQRVVVRLDDGAVEGHDLNQGHHFRCVWPGANPADGFGAGACHGGQQVAGCYPFGEIWNIDAVDRVSLDLVSSMAECRLYGASLADLQDLSLAIHLGLPGGTNGWVRTADQVIWGWNNPTNAVVKWVGAGTEDWAYVLDVTGQLKAFTDRANFRCVGLADRSMAAEPACPGDCLSVQSRSPLLLEGLERAVAEPAAAQEACFAAGGVLPGFREWNEALQQSLVGGVGQWLWTMDGLVRPGATRDFLVLRWDGVSSTSWYPRWEVSVAAGQAPDQRPFRCAYKARRPQWPACTAGKVLVEGDGGLECVPGVAGSSNGAASSEAVDKWRNAWDDDPREAASYGDAALLCGGMLARLPSASELFRVRSNGDWAIGDAFDAEWLWTSTPSWKKGFRVAVRLSDGETSEFPVEESHGFRCLWPSLRSAVFHGANCFGPPGSECFDAGQGFFADKLDRPVLDPAAAAWECGLAKAVVPSAAQMAKLIHARLPGGTESWLWVNEPKGQSDDATLGYGVVKWQGVGLPTWSWSTTTASASKGNAKRAFRCVFDPMIK